jgi:hypothetical protein
MLVGFEVTTRVAWVAKPITTLKGLDVACE